MNALLLLALATLITGCSFAQRTQVARYDTTMREKRENIEVFTDGRLPTQKYREIALYTVDGEAHEEATAIEGFIRLARDAGADAIIAGRMVAAELYKARTKEWSDESQEKMHASSALVIPRGRQVFRAKAIVYE
jgi:hypothetical protein